jgi:hypothetical protein
MFQYPSGCLGLRQEVHPDQAIRVLLRLFDVAEEIEIRRYQVTWVRQV